MLQAFCIKWMSEKRKKWDRRQEKQYCILLCGCVVNAPAHSEWTVYSNIMIDKTLVCYALPPKTLHICTLLLPISWGSVDWVETVSSHFTPIKLTFQSDRIVDAGNNTYFTQLCVYNNMRHGVGTCIHTYRRLLM